MLHDSNWRKTDKPFISKKYFNNHTRQFKAGEITHSVWERPERFRHKDNPYKHGFKRLGNLDRRRDIKKELGKIGF